MNQELSEKSTLLLGALEDLGIVTPDNGVLLKLIKIQAGRIDELETDLENALCRLEDLEASIDAEDSTEEKV